MEGISACRNFFHLMLTLNFSHLTLHEFFSHPPITFLLVRPLEILINTYFQTILGLLHVTLVEVLTSGNFSGWRD